MRRHTNQVPQTSSDTETETNYEDITRSRSCTHKRVGKERLVADRKSNIKRRISVENKKRTRPTYNNISDYEDIDDCGSTLRYARAATRERCLRERMKRRARKAASCRNIPSENSSEESDSPGFERIDKAELKRHLRRENRKTTPSSTVRPSTNYYESPSTMERPKDSSDESSSSSDSSSSDDSEVEGAYVSDVEDLLLSHSEENFTQNNIIIEESIKKHDDPPVIEISSDEELKESEKQEVPSRKENEDETKKAPEENEENNTILADKATSGDGLEANCNVEIEGSSPKHVSNEQPKEKEHDKAVSVNRKVPSRKKQNVEKTGKRNKASETVCTVAAPRKRHIKKKTAPCSDQSHLAKNSSEAEAMNRLQSPNQSRSDSWTQTSADSPALAEDNDSSALAEDNDSPALAEDKECDYTDNGVPDGNEEIPAAAVDKTEKQVKKKLSSLQPSEIFQALADSVLGQGPLIESESDDESRQAPTNTCLPLKFWFGYDEPEMIVEMTEYEREIADLFAESFLAWAMEDQSSRQFPEEPRCVRESHEFYHDDENGVYCIHCHYIELGPRDILPPWAKKTRRKPGKKRSADRGEIPECIDERPAEPSMKNIAAFNCPEDGTVWDVIPGVRDMYEHQREGLEFLWKNIAGSTNLAEMKNMAKPNEVGGCIICHAPGTGKTRLTIVFLESFLKVFPDSRPVIIAPASMLLTWEEEFEKWAFPYPFHNLNKTGFMGNASKNVPKEFRGPKCLDTDTVRMVKIFSWDKEGSILGISYNLFEKLTGEGQVKGRKTESMREILLEKPGLVIMDEGHTPRNEASNIWKALLKLKTDKRVSLSGTPFQNNFGELFNTLKVVRPAVANVLAEDKTFFEIDRSRKRKLDQSGPNKEVIDGIVLEKLKSTISPFVNIHKGTVLLKLPGLRDSVIILKPPELQKSLIETLDKHECRFVYEHKVALISMHPYLFTHLKNPDIDMNLVEASKMNPNEGSKTKFIIELMRLSMAANEKVLIFSQFIQPLDLIMDLLKEVLNLVEGKHILYLNGKLHHKRRQNLIKTFNGQSEAKVMLASIKCCSEGISLVGASRVVLLDVVWNPSVERQAISRAYRIGQTKIVHTYHLMTSGTTEGDKYCKQVEKERLSELVFCSSNGESDIVKNQASVCSNDKILENMLGSANSANMFEKIIYQPKETDLLQNFGLV